MTERTEVEIWANGCRGCLACISGMHYETGSIVVGVEQDKMTQYQMLKALDKEFPDTDFVIIEEGDMWVARNT